jgi:hypothetical protein
MKKDFKKVALIKTDYEEGRLQPTPAGHPQLATPRATTFYWFHYAIESFFLKKSRDNHFRISWGV